MNRWLRFSGLIGLIVLLFGLIGGVLVNSFDALLIRVHLLLGIALLLTWVVAASGAGQIGDFTQMVVGRRGRFAGNVTLYSIVFIGILAVINYAANRNDRRWDLTEAGAFSLSSQSISVIQGLKKPLKIVGVTEAPNVDEVQMTDLFALYKYHNKTQVTTDLINPRTKPQLLDTYGMKQGNIVYIEYGEGENKGVSRLNEMTEEAITNAIVKLTRGEAKKIYYVQGHEELALDGEDPQGLKLLVDSINDEHLAITGLVLSRVAAVPADAAAVILAGPKKSLLPQEKEMLIKYGDEGGRLLLMTDPRSPTDVKDIAAHFGIEVGENVVIDQIQRLFAGPTLGAQPIVVDYGTHDITKSFNKQTITIFNIASTVRASGKSDGAVKYTDLLKSSGTAWGEKNLAGIFDSEDPVAVLEADDVQGPVSLAAVYEKNLEPAKPEGQKDEQKDNQAPEFKKVSRVVVFGDSDWIMNQNLNVYANRDLILNTLNWVVGEEGGVTIRPRSIRASYAPIPRTSFLLFMASGFVIPELILAVGLFIWWRRKTMLA